MRFNTKVRYGLRTMLEITKADQDQGIYQKDIAINQGISLKYLDHIISYLKAAGLIRNVGGKNSGYKLSRPPGDITTYDIYRAFEYNLEINDCLSQDYNCERYNICSVKDFWFDLNSMIIDYMNSHTLDDLQHKQNLLKADPGN